MVCPASERVPAHKGKQDTPHILVRKRPHIPLAAIRKMKRYCSPRLIFFPLHFSLENALGAGKSEFL